MFKGFRDFIMRGNVVDLAVGVIIGAAFGKIVSSFVNDIIMPPIGLLTGGVDFANKFVVLKGGSYPSLAAAKADKNAVVLTYGVFINAVVEFLIIAFCVYLLVQAVNRLYPKPVAAVTKRPCPRCTLDIPIAATRCPNCTSELAAA